MGRNSLVGIDVSKARLDVAFRPSGKRLVISNDPRGISRPANVLKEAKPECVLLGATGGYELKRLRCDASRNHSTAKRSLLSWAQRHSIGTAERYAASE